MTARAKAERDARQKLGIYDGAGSQCKGAKDWGCWRRWVRFKREGSHK